MKNIYLISSSSIHLLDDKIKDIVENNSYTTFDLNSLSIDDILEEAAYFSLFDDKKYLIIKNANIFSASKSTTKEESSTKKYDKLIKYLEDPNPNTILIFTLNNKVDSKKKIVKIIKEQYEYIEINDLKPKEIFNKVINILNNEKYKIDSNTLYYIINNSLNNYDLVINEIEKIKLYYGKPCEIKYEDVINIVSRVLEDNEYKFVDAVMDKDLKNSYKICDDLMLESIPPQKLVTKIYYQVRNVLLVKEMMNKCSEKEIMSKLGIGYDFQLEKLLNYTYKFSKEELESYIKMIGDFDYKVKNGKIGNLLALQLIIMKICA